MWHDGDKMMGVIWVRFLSVARSKLRLCSANHRAGYFSNLTCDWLSIVWAYSKQETENGPWIVGPLNNEFVCKEYNPSIYYLVLYPENKWSHQLEMVRQQPWHWQGSTALLPPQSWHGSELDTRMNSNQVLNEKYIDWNFIGGVLHWSNFG